LGFGKESHAFIIRNHMLANTLEEILRKSSGERAIYQLLKKNPVLVLWSFHKIGGHSQYVLADFPIGIRYRADFVIPLEVPGITVVRMECWRLICLKYDAGQNLAPCVCD
jgi:hypothetical protein